MCGGTIEFEPGATVGICDSCGTKQTLPRLDDDRRSNLYDRASHLRRNNEFDKAAALYEQILNEDPSDAEAYWSLVLCRYGIEYVEDPRTRRRVPTVNRTQYTSIFDDEDYKSALRYADSYQRSIYEEEAAAVNEIQKGILAISQKEKPFDVFICYKETDANGRRTPDSVLANELYHQLTQEGFKVFFARITLEDKLGTAYEPYIFAALNSARVMVVLGTRPEYFNAVWVKNEWSRYLTLVKASGGKKVLIPAYRDMDPYDLPEEFSHLQAQDMSKLGFMQDLIRGVKKIVGAQTPKTPAGIPPAAVSDPGVAPLLDRAFLFLEDGEWDKADDFCEQVLNREPRNGRAYLGKLMAQLRVKKPDDLGEQEELFENNKNYQKALRFGDEALSASLTGYIDRIADRQENERQTGIYNRAMDALRRASSPEEYENAAAIFRTVPGFKDADERAAKCLEKAEKVRLQAENDRKDAVYAAARKAMSAGTIPGFTEAVAGLETIAGWRDADELINSCQTQIERLRAKEEADRLERQRLEEQKRAETAKKLKKTGKILGLAAAALALCLGLFLLAAKVMIPTGKYNRAEKLLSAGQYDEAAAAFTALGDFKDSEERAAEAKEAKAEAERLAEEARLEAERRAEEERLEAERKAEEERLEAERKAEAERQAEKEAAKNENNPFAAAQVGDYITFGSYEQDNDLENGAEPIEWLVLDKRDGRLLVISKYALDCREFDNTGWGENGAAPYSWEASSIRAWLNEDFINNAFSAEEQLLIPTATVRAEKNPLFETDPGRDTQDKVFLLNWQEVETYLGSTYIDRTCEPTESAKAAMGDMVSHMWNGKCSWWLRSPSRYSDMSSYVDTSGSLNGVGVNSLNAVRPAVWIELEEPEGSIACGTDYAAARVGDIVTLGTYEQDNDLANGKEPIEWQVLDKQDGRLLVISKYGLDCKQYHVSQMAVTWETCTLRAWLNGTFLHDAFNWEELARIPTVTVNADENPYSDTDPGNATQDKVFLLSITEASQYFRTGNSRMCAPTAYAVGQGADTIDDFEVDGKAACWWWLRSPGGDSDYAVNVGNDGDVYNVGSSVQHPFGAVRPAVWIEYEHPEGGVARGTDYAAAWVGDTVTLGVYEQDNDLTNGKEPIEWLVLDKEDGRLMLISKYGLDYHVYNNGFSWVPWGGSPLRAWLNGQFLNSAFSREEQALIPTRLVTAENNPYFDSDPGYDTWDKVYLLSVREAEEYFHSDSERLCQGTAYCFGKYRMFISGDDSCWWWLRTTGGKTIVPPEIAENVEMTGATIVYDSGSVGALGYIANMAGVAVRPVVWIDLGA